MGTHIDVRPTKQTNKNVPTLYYELKHAHIHTLTPRQPPAYKRFMFPTQTFVCTVASALPSHFNIFQLTLHFTTY